MNTWKIPDIDTILSFEDSSSAIGKNKFYFRNLKQERPFVLFSILFLSQNGNDLVMGHHKYYRLMQKQLNKINTMIEELSDNDEHDEFASFLVQQNFFTRKWQWTRNISEFKTTLKNITSTKYWQKILDLYVLFKGMKMNNKSKLLSANNINLNEHPLRPLMTINNIIRFEKSHTLGSAYGYSLAMSNTNYNTRAHWLKYIKLIRVLQDIYVLDDNSQILYNLISTNLPYLYKR